ncbi:MAG: hypothetical protein IJC69_07005 [Clostridia bacterium]|nr:hypothetical protein [Clostridia bacterium]
MKMRKVLTMLLAAVMLVGLLPAISVSADPYFDAVAGLSASYPAVCTSFAEFKYAMESDKIKYVALGDIEEEIAPVAGSGEVFAIEVNGTKNLVVFGDAVFLAPKVKSGNKTIVGLLHTDDYDILNITGNDSITFCGSSDDSYNAAIYNDGGTVSIEEASIGGIASSSKNACAIVQKSGGLSIVDGGFYGETTRDIHEDTSAVCAVYLNGGSTWISGGEFRTFNNEYYSDSAIYGLYISPYATAYLSGGVYYGICLSASNTPLSDYMDEDVYTVYTDGQKFDPESEYSQEYTESGKVVRIVNFIDKVDIHINTPVAGRTVYSDVYMVPYGCDVNGVNWYEDGESVSSAHNFKAGKSYMVEITLIADKNAEFPYVMTSASINNDPSTAYQILTTSGRSICLQLDMGVCLDLVKEVALTVTAPKEGQKPSYTVGCGDTTYYAVGGSSNYTDYRQWYMSSDGYDWWIINENHTFMSGYYYKFYADIKTASGYEFPLDSNLDPAVKATVNGNSAKANVAYDQDQSTYITIEYDFGECNDSVIEEVKIAGVTEPVAGEYPTYSAAVVGSGYHIDTTKNTYYDAYWVNEKWYYIKNGIGWYDKTDSKWVYENEKFVPGHEYEVNVYLKVDDGYEFYHDKWYDMLISATVNGNEAGFANWGSDCAINQEITYTFTCEQQTITNLILYLDAPEAGKNPYTYSLESAYPELYGADESYGLGTGIYWHDCEGNILTDEDEFIPGMQYKVEIKIVPTKVEEVNMCKFANSVNVVLNGNTLSEYGDWDAVYASDTVVYIYYTFKKAAQSPEAASDSVEVYRSGNNCIVKLNEAENGVTYIAAAYSGEFLNKAVTLSVGDAVTLTGDTVKVFSWKKGKLEPVCEAAISGNQ